MSDEEVSGLDDLDLGDRTWSKVERDLQKQGFREGASKGREEAFQAGFDLGYSHGFKIGGALGFSKGYRSLIEILNTDNANKQIEEQEHPLGNDHSRLSCILCDNKTSVKENLEEKKLEDVSAQQMIIDELVIKNLIHEMDPG